MPIDLRQHLGVELTVIGYSAAMMRKSVVSGVLRNSFAAPRYHFLWSLYSKLTIDWATVFKACMNVVCGVHWINRDFPTI